jgi:hypothetical protein
MYIYEKANKIRWEQGLDQGNIYYFPSFSSHSDNQEHDYCMTGARGIQVMKLDTSVINLKVRYLGINFVINKYTVPMST